MGDHSARYLATAGETVHEGGCLPGDGDGDGDGHGDGHGEPSLPGDLAFLLGV